MSKHATIYTNDTRRRQLGLVVTGFVERVYTISPRRLVLKGFADEAISKKISIKPVEKYAFKILEAKAQRGENIKVALAEVKAGPSVKEYEITVANLKKEKGRYVDTVELKTDSKLRPQIKIFVRGDINQRQ